jgi:hypothetical protein
MLMSFYSQELLNLITQKLLCFILSFCVVFNVFLLKNIFLKAKICCQIIIILNFINVKP